MIETLRKVRLADGDRVLDSCPMMLSGGMRQRVLIGMALLNKPRLLIADEPGAALDVTTQHEILALLDSLVAEEGLSLLLITHNLGVVGEMADRVFVMERGHIVETGTRDAVFDAPEHPFTHKLMVAVPPLYGDKVKTVDHHGLREIVTLRGVCKDFQTRSGVFNRVSGKIRAVDKVSLSVHQGDIFGIAGESGSGKTTLAKMIMRLSRPTGGEIEGRDITGFAGTREFRKLIQIVYQNPASSLNPRRTVADQLAVPLNFTGEDRAATQRRISELLDLVDLAQSYRSMYPHELSGGQKPRVAIARVLSVNPKIVMLDEPTSALDVLVQSNVIDLLLRLRDEFDLTYIFISHDLSLMRNFCSRAPPRCVCACPPRNACRRWSTGPTTFARRSAASTGWRRAATSSTKPASARWRSPRCSRRSATRWSGPRWSGWPSVCPAWNSHCRARTVGSASSSAKTRRS